MLALSGAHTSVLSDMIYRIQRTSSHHLGVFHSSLACGMFAVDLTQEVVFRGARFQSPQLNVILLNRIIAPRVLRRSLYHLDLGKSLI